MDLPVRGYRGGYGGSAARRVGIHEYFDIHQFAQLFVDEDEDPVDDDDLARVQPLCGVEPPVCGEVVDRLFDGASGFQIFDVPDQERRFEESGWSKFTCSGVAPHAHSGRGSRSHAG